MPSPPSLLLPAKEGVDGAHDAADGRDACERARRLRERGGALVFPALPHGLDKYLTPLALAFLEHCRARAKES